MNNRIIKFRSWNPETKVFYYFDFGNIGSCVDSNGHYFKDNPSLVCKCGRKYRAKGFDRNGNERTYTQCGICTKEQWMAKQMPPTLLDDDIADWEHDNLKK